MKIVLLLLTVFFSSSQARAQECDERMLGRDFTNYLIANALSTGIPVGKCLRRSFLALAYLDPRSAGVTYRESVVDAAGFLGQSCQREGAPLKINCQFEPDRHPVDRLVDVPIPGCACVNEGGRVIVCPTLTENGTDNSGSAPQRIVDQLNRMTELLLQPSRDAIANQRTWASMLLNVRRLCSDMHVDPNGPRRDLAIPEVRAQIRRGMEQIFTPSR